MRRIIVDPRRRRRRASVCSRHCPARPPRDDGRASRARSCSTGRATTSTRTSRRRRSATNASITTRADDPKGLDINAQICFFPGTAPRRTWFIAGEDTGQPNPPQGWGIFQLHGHEGRHVPRHARSASSPPPTRARPTTPRTTAAASCRDGRVLTTDVGNQADRQRRRPAHRLVPAVRPHRQVRYCKIDVGIATAGGICGRRAGPRLRRVGPAPDRRRPPLHRPVPDVGHARAAAAARTTRTGAPMADEGDERRSSSRPPLRSPRPNAIVPAPRGGFYVSSVFNGVIAEYSGTGHVPPHDPPAARGRDRSAPKPFSTGTPLGIGVDRRRRRSSTPTSASSSAPTASAPATTPARCGASASSTASRSRPTPWRRGLAFPDGIGVLEP